MKTGKAPSRSRAVDSLIRVGVLVVLAAVSAAPQSFAAITTFAPDCLTPKTSFNLGDTVCAKADGLNGFRLAWVDPDGFIVQRTDLTSDSQVDSLALPSTGQSSIAGLFIANNLGTWRVTAITSRNSVKTCTFFTVKDPSNPRVDLSIFKDVVGGDPPLAGGSVQYSVTLLNLGPDDAVNTRFVDNQFSNATFNSLMQTSGPSFSCNGADCTIANFPAGAEATFLLSFTAGVAGGVLENTVTVSSDTTELHADDNSSSAPPLRVFSGGTAPSCLLECPNNMVVSTNTTNQGTPGAIVTLPSPEAFGTCGPVTLSPASGSFFPVGATTVTATASGGGFCSFTVTVIDTPPPTINCPADITVAALSGQATAFVPDPNAPASNPGTATATGSNVSVIGLRSDDLPLSDAYPVGLTLITWTATDDGGRSVSCTQKITVTSPDAPTIRCPSDKTFTAPAGTCQITVLAEDIGLPSTTGLNVTVTETRSDGLALTAPYPAGDTVVTWTASNSLGNASCTQRIHVNATDTQPPVLTIPPDISTTTTSCSAVLDDELGVATAEDNCSSSVSVIRSGVPANFVFPTGTTNVTYTATDAAGNTSTGVQHVVVLESPAVRPMITPPPDVTANTGPGATACGTIVSNATLGIATATDNCPGVTISRTGVTTGNLFPVGETLVTYVATDASGSTASATQKVKVVDNTPPTITCPANLTLEPTCPTGAVATWTPPVGVDNCPGATTAQSGGPANGSAFPIGTTTVSYTTTDAAGNSTSCSFTVTVLTVTAAIEKLKASVNASSLQPPTKQGLIPKLDAALAAIGRGNSTLACQNIATFANSVQNYIDHGDISAAQGQEWLTTAAHITNALGCTNNPCM